MNLENDFERRVWVRVANRVLEIRGKIDENRAILTANAVGKLFKG
jgi:hypothetical protein